MGDLPGIKLITAAELNSDAVRTAVDFLAV